jgi:glyoxylase-like metal-dependent hydrolase (beta-lactamase superfamily II)
MFPRAKTLEYGGVWEGGRIIGWNRRFTDNIEIVRTPGHSYDGISLLVETSKGILAIVGDVFWKENFPSDDPYANDKKELKQSREKIIELADYVIPGHGKMFKTKK